MFAFENPVPFKKKIGISKTYFKNRIPTPRRVAAQSVFNPIESFGRNTQLAVYLTLIVYN